MDIEEVMVVYMEDQTSHNIPLSQNLIQSKVLTLLILLRLREERKLQKRSWKLAELGSWGFREDAISVSNARGATSADTEATSNNLENLAKIIHEGGYTKQQVFNVK